MKDGTIVAARPPEEVLTEALVERVFGLSCLVIACPVSARPLIVPRGRS